MHRHAPPFPDELENPLVLGDPEQLQGVPPVKSKATASPRTSQVSDSATVTEAIPWLAHIPGHLVVLVGYHSHLKAWGCGGWYAVSDVIGIR